MDIIGLTLAEEGELLTMAGENSRVGLPADSITHFVEAEGDPSKTIIYFGTERMLVKESYAEIYTKLSMIDQVEVTIGNTSKSTMYEIVDDSQKVKIDEMIAEIVDLKNENEERRYLLSEIRGFAIRRGGRESAHPTIIELMNIIGT